VDEAAAKVGALDNQTAADVLLGGSAAAGVKFRRYMLVRTLMSVLTGALVWATAALTGLTARARMGGHRLLR